jgi:hypothetical protein
MYPFNVREAYYYNSYIKYFIFKQPDYYKKSSI